MSINTCVQFLGHTSAWRGNSQRMKHFVCTPEEECFLVMFVLIQLFKINYCLHCSFSMICQRLEGVWFSLTRRNLENRNKCSLFFCAVISLLAANETSNAVSIDNWSIFFPLFLWLTVWISQWLWINENWSCGSDVQPWGLLHFGRGYNAMFIFAKLGVKIIFPSSFILFIIRFLGFPLRRMSRKVGSLM